jgi:hypothetical protein
MVFYNGGKNMKKMLGILVILGMLCVIPAYAAEVQPESWHWCGIVCQIVRLWQHVTVLEGKVGNITQQTTIVQYHSGGGGPSDSYIVEVVNESQQFATKEEVYRSLAECRYGKDYTEHQYAEVYVEKTGMTYNGDGWQLIPFKVGNLYK